MKVRPLQLAVALLAASCGPASPIAPSPPVTVVALPPAPIAVAVDPTADEPPQPVSTEGGFSLFHGDPARTGHTDAPPIARPRILWHARVGIQGWLNAPLVAGDRVIVPSSGTHHNAADDRDGVVALSLATGRPLWQAHFGGDANGAAIAGQAVIAGADDGTIHALDLTTGRVLWTQTAGGKVYTGPLPLGDQVIVGDAAGTLRALALSDGATRWKVHLDGALRGGASTDGRAIYAVSQGGEAVALRPDGGEIWRVHVDQILHGPAELYAAPIVTAGKLIVPYARDSYYDTPAIVALDTRTGKLAWEARGGSPASFGNLRFTPALSAGRLVYAEAYSGDVTAVDASTGALAYRRTVGACFFPSWASPIAAGELVYVPRFDGAVYAVRAPTGAVAWQLYLGDEAKAGPTIPAAIASQSGCEWEVPAGHALYAPPAIAEDGTLLVGSGEGVLWAIGEDRR